MEVGSVLPRIGPRKGANSNEFFLMTTRRSVLKRKFATSSRLIGVGEGVGAVSGSLSPKPVLEISRPTKRKKRMHPVLMRVWQFSKRVPLYLEQGRNFLNFTFFGKSGGAGNAIIVF